MAWSRWQRCGPSDGSGDRFWRGVGGAALLMLSAASLVEGAVSPTVLQALARAGVFRQPSVETAWKSASQAHRPLIVLFTADRCPHCDRMVVETFADPRVRTLVVPRAETALAHDQTDRELIAKLRVRAFPTTLVVSDQGMIVDVVEGYLPPEEFVGRVARWLTPTASTAPRQAASAKAAASR